MEIELKKRLNFTLTPANANWLKQMCKASGIPMSLFVDSLITGMRASMKDAVTEKESMALAFNHLAEGIRK